METLRKSIITDDDPSLRIESFAIIHLRGVFQGLFQRAVLYTLRSIDGKGCSIKYENVQY